MASSIAEIPTLADYESYMTAEEVELTNLLLANGQAHLFSEWAVGADEEQKHAFFKTVRDLHVSYVGGLPNYLTNARKLLADSAAGVNPLDGYTPEVPAAVRVWEYDAKHQEEWEAAGLHIVKDCVFVLVAGGLGERLGFNGIKLALPTQITTETCYLELYINQLLALQAESNALAGTSVEIPLCIMTSDDTHAPTVALLEAKNNYGMKPGQIIIVKQEKVASLLDNDAHIAHGGTPYSISTKPHGHGDVHTLLYQGGHASRWATEGKRFVVFFQDTNAPCFLYAPIALGATAAQGFQVVSMCVPRKAGEAVGAITRLRHTNGSAMTVNVEYNQLEPLLKATVNPAGDVNDSTGYSPYPGNINQLIFDITTYAKTLQSTHGLVPEFVNPKYADAKRNVFKSATRLECMMQDLPKLMDSSVSVGVVVFEVDSFSPVKNNAEAGVAKLVAGTPPQSALSGEMDVYASACKRLTALGAHIEAAKPMTALGITVNKPAAVVLDPRVSTSHLQLRHLFPSASDIQISQRSTLVVRGANVVIHSLKLDGALIIDVEDGHSGEIRDITVTNAGWEFVNLSDADRGAVSDAIALRGYKLVKHAHRHIRFTAEGMSSVDVVAA